MTFISDLISLLNVCQWTVVAEVRKEIKHGICSDLCTHNNATFVKGKQSKCRSLEGYYSEADYDYNKYGK